MGAGRTRQPEGDSKGGGFEHKTGPPCTQPLSPSTQRNTRSCQSWRGRGGGCRLTMGKQAWKDLPEATG